MVAKSGNKYEILVLDETAKYMTLPVLKRLRELVKAGAKISGTKPEASPSLGDNAAEFQNIVDEIWKGENITTIDKINTQPDVIITKNTNKILFRHRTIAPPSGGGGLDIYWLNNRSDDKNAADISFRIAGKIPELWNPVTGKTEKVSYQIKYGRTIIPLTFESWDAYFIVFKDATKINVVTIKSKTEKEVLTIMSPWSVTFEDNTATFDKLTSWSENTDSDIKYFSGTAIYKNTFNIKTPITGLGFLDLGSVKNIAEVIVNGKSLGTVWKKPFRVELGNALKAGENTIEIKVTNLWVNRLIGDAQPDVKQKTTFTTMPFYKGSEALMPSGLMGPVRVLMKE